MRMSILTRFIENNKYDMFIDIHHNSKKYNNNNLKNDERISFLNVGGKKLFWNNVIIDYENFNKTNMFFITNIITLYEKYKKDGYNIRYIPFYWSFCDYNDIINDVALVDGLFSGHQKLDQNNQELFNNISKQLKLKCVENNSYLNDVVYLNKIKKDLTFDNLQYINKEDNVDETYFNLKSSLYNILCITDRYTQNIIVNSRLLPVNDFHYSVCDKNHLLNYEYSKTIQNIFDFEYEYKEDLYIVKHDKQKYIETLYKLEDIIFDNFCNIEKDVYENKDILSYLKEVLNK